VGKIAEEFEDCKLQTAANSIISMSRIGNQYLNEKEPWNLIKKDKARAAGILYVAAQIVKALVITSAPIIPFAAEELWKTLNLQGSVHEQKWMEALNPLLANHKIAKPKPLFKKIEDSEQDLDRKLEDVRKNLAKT
jgi:methionyl-tRNA synthetase